MNPVILPFLTFGGVAMAVAALCSILSDIYLRDRSLVSQRVDDTFRKKQKERAKKSLLSKDLSKLAYEANAEMDDSPSVTQRFQMMVEQSGLDITPQKLRDVAAGSGIVCGVLLGMLRQSSVVGVLGLIVGVTAPLIFVHVKRNVRIEKLRSQLPDAFDLMGRVIRSGQTTAQALLAVADEFPLPIAGEFAYCYEQQNLGLSPDNAFRDLGRRTGLLEIKIFVVAVLVQQQTGGNLAELFDKLSTIIRDRYRMRGQIASLTAEGRMQGAVLLGLPPAMFAMMLFLNPGYGRTLFDHPSLLVITLVSELFGALWMRKIVNFDF